MANGNELLRFNAASGLYTVRVRHRNHLGTATSAPLQLGGTIPLVDLVNQPTYGAAGQMVLGGQAMLWPGDGNFDGQVKYVGADNDRDPILVAVGGTVPTNVAVGYRREDVNMDHLVKYVGVNNDRDIILQVIGGTVPTAVRSAQLP